MGLMALFIRCPCGLWATICKNWYKAIILNYCIVCLDVSNLKATFIYFENYFFTSIQNQVQVQLCAGLVHWTRFAYSLSWKRPTKTMKSHEVMLCRAVYWVLLGPTYLGPALNLIRPMINLSLGLHALPGSIRHKGCIV